MMYKNTPKVSIIVTTKNEGRIIYRLLISLKKQTYKQCEIIVVDNKSTDKTVQISKQFTDKIYTYGPERSAQRNFGAKKSKGDYLLFLDADMELSPNVIKSCVDIAAKHKNLGGVVIPEISVGNNYWEKVKAFERSFYNLSGDETTDAARFFKRSAFNKVGGYDEAITGPEDWDLPEAISEKGFKTGRINQSIYHHENITSLFNLAKKKFYYGLRSHRYLSKRKISLIGPKTIYILRPVFYRQWKRFFRYPGLSVGMFIMLISETVAGGTGYIIGRVKKI